MVGIAPLFGGRRCAEHARRLLTVLKGIGQVPTHGSVGDDKRLVVAGGTDVGGIDVAEADAVGLLGGSCHGHLDLPAGQLGEVGLGGWYRRKLVKVVRMRRLNCGALGRHFVVLLLVD